MLPCANNEDLALAVGEFSILRGSCTEIYALAFGFLGGSEVQKAGVGNLGLQDREVSMFWRPMVSKMMHIMPCVIALLAQGGQVGWRRLCTQWQGATTGLLG